MSGLLSRPIRLAVAVAAGALPVAVADARGLPGDGSFAPAAIAAGLVAYLAVPGWSGLAAVLVGMLAADLWSVGLVGFGTAAYAVLIAYGSLLAATVLRVVRPPTAPWWRDRGTWAWIVAAILIGASLAWLAIDLASNPF